MTASLPAHRRLVKGRLAQKKKKKGQCITVVDQVLVYPSDPPLDESNECGWWNTLVVVKHVSVTVEVVEES
jgi:hypothetical protein